MSNTFLSLFVVIVIPSFSICKPVIIAKISNILKSEDGIQIINTHNLALK